MTRRLKLLDDELIAKRVFTKKSNNIKNLYKQSPSS